MSDMEDTEEMEEEAQEEIDKVLNILDNCMSAIPSDLECSNFNVYVSIDS